MKERLDKNSDGNAIYLTEFSDESINSAYDDDNDTMPRWNGHSPESENESKRSIHKIPSFDSNETNISRLKDWNKSTLDASIIKEEKISSTRITKSNSDRVKLTDKGKLGELDLSRLGSGNFFTIIEEKAITKIFKKLNYSEIINVFCKLSKEDRIKYKENLLNAKINCIKCLMREKAYHVKLSFMGLFLEDAAHDALLLNQSLKIKNWSYFSIILSHKSYEEIKAIQQKYTDMFQTSLIKDAENVFKKKKIISVLFTVDRYSIEESEANIQRRAISIFKHIRSFKAEELLLMIIRFTPSTFRVICSLIYETFGFTFVDCLNQGHFDDLSITVMTTLHNACVCPETFHARALNTFLTSEKEPVFVTYYILKFEDQELKNLLEVYQGLFGIDVYKCISETYKFPVKHLLLKFLEPKNKKA